MIKKGKMFKKLIFEVLLIIFLLIINTMPIFADSGFDTSYDSYPKYDSQSSYDRYDDYDYDRYYDRYYEDDDDDSFFTLILLIIAGVGIVVVKIFRGIANSINKKSNSSENSNIEEQKYYDPVENRIKEYIPDFNRNAFLKEAYNNYISIQNAWMNFKIDDVKDIISRELYSIYSTQITELQIKREKNVMEDFNLIKSSLRDVIVENNIITIMAEFIIEFYDYVIVESTKDVLRGSNDQKIRVKYELVFEKNLKPYSVSTCPSCGADISKNNAGFCRICKTKLIPENAKWVLREKKILDKDFI